MKTSRVGLLETVLVLDADCEALGDLATAVRGSPYGAGYASFMEEVERRRPTLSPPLVQALGGFATSAGHSGGLLLRGVPVPDDLGHTPNRPFVDARRPTGTEAMLLALSRLVGAPIGFPDWHEGDLVQNLYPLRAQRSEQNASNAVRLEVHTETAFRPGTPDVVALLCLRGDPRVTTTVADLRQAAGRVSGPSSALLDSPGFAFVRKPSRSTGDGPLLTTPKPIRQGTRFHYAEALVGVTAAHQHALEEIWAAVSAVSLDVTLRAGDLLFLDNRHLVHGRIQYQPRYDGTDRWIQRCLLRCPTVVEEQP